MPRKAKKNRNGLGSKPVERGGSFTMLLTLGYKPDGSVFKKRVTAPTEEEVLTRAKEIQVQYARGLLG